MGKGEYAKIILEQSKWASVWSEEKKKFIKCIDSEYGFNVARKLLEFKSTPRGFRIAGTEAERKAAEWIYDEMKSIGLHDVEIKDIPVDSWDFRDASVSILSPEITYHTMRGGSFACLPGTSKDGIVGEVIYVGDGTKTNYDGIDVREKIVLIDTDAYFSYWYNSLFMQAEVRGAKAIIATVTDRGPGTYNDDLISIQDIMGSVKIPAVILNKRDGEKCRQLLKEGTLLTVNIKAEINITYGTKAHYVVGKIPGRNSEKNIILGGHYDAYWDGFLDNATSLGSQLTIAKAMIDSGYKPECNFIFVMNGAEEFGRADTCFDFAVGAYNMLKQNPDWVENTVLFNNFELSALAQTDKFTIGGTCCYGKQLKKIMDEMKLADGNEFFITSTVGADDGVFTKAGIPSIMNISASFYNDDPESVSNYDHTEHDNIERYDPNAFDFNNKAFGLIDLIFDRLLFAPIDISAYMNMYWSEIERSKLKAIYSKYNELENAVNELHDKADHIYKRIVEENIFFENRKLNSLANEDVFEIYDKAWKESKKLISINKIIQLNLIKFGPDNNMIYGHTQPYKYVVAITELIESIINDPSGIGDGIKALENLDNNYLISAFDKEVYKSVSIDAFGADISDSWGKGETIPFPDLYDIITALKHIDISTNCNYEISILEKIKKEQKEILIDILDKELETVKKANGIIETIDIDKTRFYNLIDKPEAEERNMG